MRLLLVEDDVMVASGIKLGLTQRLRKNGHAMPVLTTT